MNSKNSEILKQIVSFFCYLEYKSIDAIGLLNGNAGISLFLFYYARYAENEEIENKAMDFLIDSVRQIDRYFYHSYFSGISGLCWTIDHLCNNGFIHLDNREIFKQFDNILCQSVLQDIRRDNFDFLHGGIGTLIYLLKRISNPIVKQNVEQVIMMLNEKKIQCGNLCFWNFYNISNNEYERNISISHGQSSILVFLCKCYLLGIEKNIVKSIAQMCVNYILDQEYLDARVGSFFPNKINEHSSPHKSRMGWCYGDLGIAIALWHYSRVFKDEEIEAKVIEILLFAAKRRDLALNGVIDGSLCHGCAGLAIIFRRMFYHTNIKAFYEAATYWIEQTLLMSKFPDGLIGYKANGKDISYNLLTGVSGIGLSILTFLEKKDLYWDECLLLI
ncbi:hypothetical protein FACS189413_16860 [Bacteroidia bacterium]|nr:hypothetical protein FACS189413_16860 [Bacteroidia bacterium]